MNLLMTFALLLLGSPQAAPRAAPADPWRDFQFLAGDWIAEGSGEPGQGAGGFSFQFELDRKILVRTNRADYPATRERAAFSHQDRMVIYPADAPGKFRAIYFDNEGHVIGYDAAATAAGAIVFVSRATAGVPRYRLTYTQTSGGGLAIKFEIAPPAKPGAFSTYLEGTARRKLKP